MKRIFTFVLCFVLALSLIGCAEVPPMNSGNEAPQVTTVPEAAEAAPEAGEEAPAPAGDEIEVAPDVEFVPVSADAADFEAFQKALADDTVDEILLEKNVTVTEAVTMDKTVIVAEGVTLTLEGGVDFFVDNGLLENNGTLVVTGAVDAASRPAALAIVNGGGMLNNGTLILAASQISEDTADPKGGQLRLNGGSLDNNGTVTFSAGQVPYAGGVGDISAEGAFLNNGTVTVDGCFLKITGRFVNSLGATLSTETIIYVEGNAEFDNSGTLAGAGIINQTPIAQYEN